MSIVKGYTAKCYKHAPFSSKHTIVVTGVRKSTNISAQNTYQINLTCIDKLQQKHIKMARSSHTKSSVSIDLFNLAPLPDMRKHPTMMCEIPNNFFVPDGKEHPSE